MIVRAAGTELGDGLSESMAAEAESSAKAACIYCGGRGFTRLYRGVLDRLEVVPSEWEFDRCQRCSAAILRPLPKSAELGSFYPPVYTFAPQIAEQSTLRRVAAWLEYHCLYRVMYGGQAKQIARLSGGAKGRKLLDIGCGRGLRLLELQRRGFEVCGADFDADAAAYLQAEHNIPAVACDVLDLSEHFSSGSFDTITAYYVVEHVVEINRLLRSCFDLLRPGGWLIAAVPLIDGLQPKLFGDRWCQVREAPRHVSLPSTDAMTTALHAAGFGDVRLESDSYLLSASSAALSVVPSGTTHSAYGGSAASGMVMRLLAIAAAAASLPLSVFESWIVRRPSLGVFAARKPS